MQSSLRSTEFLPERLFAPGLANPFTCWAGADLAVLLTIGDRSRRALVAIAYSGDGS